MRRTSPSSTHRRESALPPLYDLLSTVFYPELSMGMAMAIDGRFRFADIDRQALESGAKAIGLSRSFLTKRLDLLRHKLPDAANRAAAGLLGQGLDDAVLERLRRLVCERAVRYKLLRTDASGFRAHDRNSGRTWLRAVATQSARKRADYPALAA